MATAVPSRFAVLAIEDDDFKPKKTAKPANSVKANQKNKSSDKTKQQPKKQDDKKKQSKVRSMYFYQVSISFSCGCR